MGIEDIISALMHWMKDDSLLLLFATDTNFRILDLDCLSES